MERVDILPSFRRGSLFVHYGCDKQSLISIEDGPPPILYKEGKFSSPETSLFLFYGEEIESLFVIENGPSPL